MCRTYVKPTKELVSNEHYAMCTECGGGTCFKENRIEMGMLKTITYTHSEDTQARIGTPCTWCGTEIIEEVISNYDHTNGHWKVECKCGDDVLIFMDGTICRKCNQMYNAVGQPITHLGYDRNGDTEEW